MALGPYAVWGRASVGGVHSVPSEAAMAIAFHSAAGCRHERAAQVDRVDTKLSRVLYTSVMHGTRSVRRLGPCQRGRRAFSTI